MLAQFDSAILEAVARASKRSSALVHEEMKQGLYSLATLACVAPWIGLFGNVLGIVNSFQGLGTSMAAGRAAVNKGLSESMWPTAFGLMVGVVALWCYRYLEEKLVIFDQEMESVSLELLNELGRFHGRFSVESAVKHPSDGPLFGEKPLAELSRDENFERRCMLLAGTTLVMAWFVQMVRYFGQRALPWDSAARAACLYLPLMFAISLLLMHPLWTKLLRRRSGGLAALGSTFCLCWVVAELVSGVSLP